MRKIVVIFICLITLIGCQKKSPLEQLIESMPQQTYTTESNQLNVSLDLKTLDDSTIRYRVLIDNPKENLDNVKAIVLCEEAISEEIPSFGFYENDKCHLYKNKIDKENNYYEGLSLMGLTKTEQIKVYVYLSYEINDELFEEYILLEE